MKTITISFLFLSLSIICKSQNIFHKTYGLIGMQHCYQHIQTSDKGYVMVGDDFNGIDYNLIYLKTDSSGNFEWIKRLDGINVTRGYSVIETSNHNLVFTGVTSDAADNWSVLLFKTSISGDTLWTRTYGDFYFANSCEVGEKVLQTSEGGYIITGFICSQNNGNDILLIKTDSIGNVQWVKTYGNSEWDNPEWIEQTNDLGYIIAGTSGISPGVNNMFLIKTNSLGDTLWTKTYSDGDISEGECVRQTSDNGYILLGANSNINLSHTDYYVIKTDGTGNVVWAKTYGGTGDELGTCITSTSYGDFIISGQTNSFGGGDLDIYLIKIDSNGDTLWTKSYGGISQDASFSVFETNDGGISIAGYTQNYGVTDRDIYLIKTNSNGYSGCYQFNTNTIINNQTTYIHSGMTTTSIMTGWKYANLLLTTPTINYLAECEENSISKNESSAIDITIYPNPFNKVVTFDFCKLKTNDLELIIYNTNGEMVKYYPAPINENIQFSKDEISQGIYFYIIKIKGELIDSGKLIAY